MLDADAIFTLKHDCFEKSILGYIIVTIFRCYVRALKILPECGALWHDLGVNYNHQSEASSDNEAILLAEKGAQCLKKAIQLDNANYRHWNALGFLACQKGSENISFNVFPA